MTATIFSAFFNDYVLVPQESHPLNRRIPSFASPTTTTAAETTESTAGAATTSKTQELYQQRSEVDGKPVVRQLLEPEQFNRFLRTLLSARGTRFNHDHHDTCMIVERSKNLNLVVYTANYLDPKTQAPVASGAGRRCVIQPKEPIRAYWIKLEPEHVARRRARGQMEDVCELSGIERKLAYGCTASVLTEAALLSEALGKKTPPEWQRRVLRDWHSVFQPCLAKFVALPTFPAMLLTLPPVSSTTAVASSSSPPPPPPSNVVPSSTDAGTAGEESAAVSPPSPASEAFPPEDSVPVMLAVIAGEVSLLTKVYVKSIEPKHFYQLPSVEYIEAFGISLATGNQTYEKKKG